MTNLTGSLETVNPVAWQPDGPRVGYIDGDLMVYSACAKYENSDNLDEVKQYFDDYITGLVEGLDLDDFRIFVTAGGNFRKEIYPAYKANRAKREKPKWLGDSYRHLYLEWAAKAVREYEADDLLGIALTKNPDGLLLSYDKDLNQVPGWHHNWRTHETYHVTPAEGDRFLALQCLIGDRTDNIPGIKGIGPKKAEVILGGNNKSLEAYLTTVIEAYYEHGLDYATFEKYYKCLKILRHEMQEWPELEKVKIA